MKYFAVLSLLVATFFPGSLFVPSASAQTGCPASPTSTNSVTLSVSVPEDNTYTIWTRMIVPDSSANSIWLQVDNGCAINVGDSGSFPAGQFTWVNYKDGNTAAPVSLQLTAGSHTVKLIEREGGVGVDTLIVSTDATCMPIGVGDNCQIPTSTPVVISTPTASPAAATNTPVPTLTPLPTITPTPTTSVDTIRPTVSIASPANGSVVTRNKSLTITANATDNVVIRQVQFSITGKGGNTTCIDTSFPYTCNWLVPSKPSTPYTISAVATDTSGNTATNSVTVTSSK